MTAMENLRGKLLIASPALFDPNFRRTVVLITEHNDEGAMGLVLNRPAAVTVADVVPELETLADGEAHVHIGGPVSPGALIVLAEFDDVSQAAALITGDLGFIPADTDHADLADTTRRARVFAGYSGWGPEQLEAEMDEESWIVAPARPGDAFAEDPDELWRTVVRRKGGRFPLLETLPEDPSLN